MPSLIVGIAGGTGSGKTTIAHKIQGALPAGACAIIEYDSYYRDMARLHADELARVNYDHPDALDTPLLVSHLRALREMGAVEAPIYDFTTHRRREETRAVGPAPVVIVEGILTFVDSSMRDLLDIKLFVDTDSDIRVFRRIRRDIEQRGRTFDSVREQYYRTVRPMHREFVEPSKRFADLVIPEGGNHAVALDLIVTKLRSVLPS